MQILLGGLWNILSTVAGFTKKYSNYGRNLYKEVSGDKNAFESRLWNLRLSKIASVFTNQLQHLQLFNAINLEMSQENLPNMLSCSINSLEIETYLRFTLKVGD